MLQNCLLYKIKVDVLYLSETKMDYFPAICFQICQSSIQLFEELYCSLTCSWFLLGKLKPAPPPHQPDPVKITFGVICIQEDIKNCSVLFPSCKNLTDQFIRPQHTEEFIYLSYKHTSHVHFKMLLVMHVLFCFKKSLQDLL